MESKLSRILIHEPRQTAEDYRALLGDDNEIVLCVDRESLFDALAAKRPHLLIYVLDDLMLDLVVLTVIRRVAPHLPLILLGGPSGLEARRSVQELKPTYYGIFPLEPSELADAVRGTLNPRGRAVSS